MNGWARSRVAKVMKSNGVEACVLAGSAVLRRAISPD
jgi:hypothetical protein